MRPELHGHLGENGIASQIQERPLAGRHIALTWSVEQGRFVCSQLEAAGARVIPLFAGAVVPVRDTTALDAALRNVNRYDWIVLTSLADVDTFAKRLVALGLGPDACRHVYIAMLIPVTTRARQLAAQSPQVVPADVLADDIAAGLRGLAGKRLLLLNAEHRHDRYDRYDRYDTLATALRRRGADVDEVAASHTITRPVDAPSLRSVLAPPHVDAIVCTSGELVNGLLLGIAAIGLEPERALRDTPLIALDEGAEARLREAGLMMSAAVPSPLWRHLVPALVSALSTRVTPRQRKQVSSSAVDETLTPDYTRTCIAEGVFRA